jgi:hypothetical protein
MKILGIIAMVALLLSGGAAVTVATEPEIPDVPVVPAEVRIHAPDQAAPGSDFMAGISVSEMVDFDGCQYDVSFDASVLRLDDVTSGLIGSTTIPVDLYWEVSPGIWRVVQSIPGAIGVSGSGYLAVLHFHVTGSEDDSSTISLSNGSLYDTLAEEITAVWAGDLVDVESRYLLSGLVRCGYCGKALVGQDAKSGQFTYYVCGTLLKKGAGSCPTRYFNSQRFENTVMDKIKEHVLTTENLTRLVNIVNEEMDGLALESNQRLDSIIDGIADVDRRLERLYDALETGKIQLADPAPWIQQLRQRREQLQAEKWQLE